MVLDQALLLDTTGRGDDSQPGRYDWRGKIQLLAGNESFIERDARENAERWSDSVEERRCVGSDWS